MNDLALHTTQLAASAGGWVLTYLVYSSIVTAFALLILRAARSRPSFCASVCRSALVMPLLLTVLSAVCGRAAPAGVVPLSKTTIIRSAVVVRRGPHAGGPVVREELVPLQLPTPESYVLAALFVLACSCAALGLYRLLTQRRQLRRTLVRGGSVPFQSAAITRVARALGLRSRPRVDAHSALDGPVALSGRRVLVPTDVATMPARELTALLAHEFAHLRRRDPFWFASLSVLRALTAIQPLGALLLDRFRVYAELACDDGAARVAERPTDLGRALVRIAQASPARSARALPCAVSERASLSHRVERLVAGARTNERPRAGWFATASIALGAALIFSSVPAFAPSLPPAAGAAGTEVELELEQVRTIRADR